MHFHIKTGYISLLILISIQTVSFASDEDTTKKSLFEMSIEELVEQNVTIATKSAQKLIQTPSVVSIVTAEEIKTMGYRELEEVLQSLPGFEVSQSRSGVKSIGVRGVIDIRQGGRLLVLLDGLPYNDIMYGSSVFFGKSFNLEAVDRIEIIRGPGSALYGRNAFSGVVNIISKKNNVNNDFSAGGSYGSFNTQEAYASYGSYNKKFNSRIDGKIYKTDGTGAKFDNGEGGKSLWNIGQDNIYLNANAEFGNFKLYGSYSRRTDGSSPGSFSLTNGESTFKIGTYSLSYEKDLLSNLDLNLKFYGRNEHRIQDLELIHPRTTTLFPMQDTMIPVNAIWKEGAYAKPVFDAYKYGAELELNIRVLKTNSLLVGIQGDIHGIKNATVRSNYNLETTAPLTYLEGELLQYYTKHNMPVYGPGWIKNEGHDYQNAAFYIQDVHYILENLSITLGGRLDFDSEAGQIFNPRIAFVWETSQKLLIKALYGQAYRAPTTNEQYKIMGLDKGNEKLKYEEIKTSELAFSYRHNKFYSQLSLFYNKLDHLIVQQKVNDTSNVISYFNNGRNKSYGVEFEARYLLTNSVYGFFNYSYVYSEDIRNIFERTETFTHPNISNNKFNLGLNSKIYKKLSWTLHLRYQGTVEKFKQANSNKELVDVSQDKVGDYFILNSKVIYTNLIKGLDISVAGYNLLNTSYYSQDDRNQYQPLQPKIHFLLQASYNFNL